MTDQKDDSPADLAPVLTEPAATGSVPVLTDAVVETLAPVVDESVASEPLVSAATVETLREALTAVARDLTRECVETVLEETRVELERRLSGQFEDELRSLVERVLQEHLSTRD